MEELDRNKVLVIDIEGKEYKLGYPTRKAVKIAEEKGLNVVDSMNKLITVTDKLFYTGLLAFQDISEKEAEELLDKYIEEGGDTDEIVSFLSEQYMAFIQSPEGKKKKKAKIIQI